MADSNKTGNTRQRKVERLIDKYDLVGMDSELTRRWTGDGIERYSLRDLARYFNQRILQAALEEVNLGIIDGEVENIYRLLTDDDITAGQRTETVARLENAGIDVDSLRSDFVSHQAIYKYLTERQEVSFEEKTSEERIQTARETVEKLRGRSESVTTNTLERLQNNDDIALEEFTPFVSFEVVCEQCGRQTDVNSLLSNGGCHCLISE